LEQQLIICLTKRHGKESPELKEYGDASYKMKQWLHNFRDLIFQNINVVLNFWEFPIDIQNQDGMIVTKTFPMLGKKIAPQMCGIVDAVGHLEVWEKTGKRLVKFGPSNQFITKVQFKGLDAMEPPDLLAIINKLISFDYTKGE
jgi:hypothetical protein